MRLLGGDKLQELILYVAKKSESDPRFGATKLAKLLFFIDIECYFSTGDSISGRNYQKIKNGPALKCFLPVQQEMMKDGSIGCEPEEYFGHFIQRMVAKRQPDTSLFSPIEIAVIDRIISRLWNENASSLSQKSHDFISSWHDLPDKAVISPRMCIFERRQPTTQEIEWAKTLEKRAQELRHSA